MLLLSVKTLGGISLLLVCENYVSRFSTSLFQFFFFAFILFRIQIHFIGHYYMFLTYVMILNWKIYGAHRKNSVHHNFDRIIIIYFFLPFSQSARKLIYVSFPGDLYRKIPKCQGKSLFQI